MKRRSFLQTSAFLTAGGCFGKVPGPTAGANQAWADRRKENVGVLNSVLLPDPVVIREISLHRNGRNWLVRAESTDGAVGWAIGHNVFLPRVYPIVADLIIPFFQGKDARNLESLIDEFFISESYYKMQGLLLWIGVASVEFAILDLLGRTVNRPAGDLLGGIVRRDIDLYQANNHREQDAKASLERIVRSVEEIDARAVKYKIGGRMRLLDQIPGRTEELIPLVADALGDRCVIYADANGSYEKVEDAIRIGRILEANGVAFYEEPCPFDYLWETKEIADRLTIPIAGGEQESSLRRFAWMIQNDAVQIAQPDIIYFGGLLRSLQVARLCAQKGIDCTPHISGSGMGFLYMLIFASCVENAGAFQEYKGFNDDIPWEPTGEADLRKVRNGAMPAPDGSGLGVEFDPDWLKQAERV